MIHWASKYIGRPWSLDGENCLSFAALVLEEQFGTPLLDPDTGEYILDINGYPQIDGLYESLPSGKEFVPVSDWFERG